MPAKPSGRWIGGVERGDETDRLIAEAYAVAANPTRLLDLRRLLMPCLDRSAGSDPSLDAATFHFDRAYAMLDANEPGVGGEFRGLTTFDDELERQSADLTIDDSFRVAALGPTFADAMGMAEGHFLPDWVWDPVTRDRDHAALRDLLAAPEKVFTLHLFCAPDAERPTLFAARRARDGAALSLRAVPMRWDDRTGEAFARTFALTSAETAIVRQVVDGGNLRELADRRGTAIGTVRNQLKTLLRKLSIGSQIELVCLYAGYQQSLVIETDNGPERDAIRASGPAEAETDLDIVETGPSGGAPVLFFHPMFTGPFATSAIERDLQSRGMRLIAPWRPYFGSQRDWGTGIPMVRAFTSQVAEWLREREPGPVAVLAASGGTPFALAFAQAAPDLVKKVVIAGATVPLSTRDDLGQLGVGHRIPLQMARAAPAVMRLYLRAVLALLNRGDGGAYRRAFFQGSAADTALSLTPEVSAMVGRALAHAYRHSMRAGIEELLLNAGDWSELCQEIEAPVTLMHGEEDRLAPSALIRRIADRFGFATHGPVRGAGSFLMLQRPGLVFDALAGAD